MIKRVLSRLLVGVLAVASMGAVTLVAAQPASAYACGNNSRVYETSRQPWSIRYDNQPVNAGYDARIADVPNDGQVYVTYVRLGGANLAPSSTPRWDVFNSGGGYIGVLEGTKTNSGCVSNEKWFPFYGTAGDVYYVNATYTGMAGQQHFTVNFI